MFNDEHVLLKICNLQSSLYVACSSIFTIRVPPPPIFSGILISLIAVFCFQESGEKPETMTHKDAAMFPLIASGALLGLYIFFQVNIGICILLCDNCIANILSIVDLFQGIHKSFIDRIFLLPWNISLISYIESIF